MQKSQRSNKGFIIVVSIYLGAVLLFFILNMFKGNSNDKPSTYKEQLNQENPNKENVINSNQQNQQNKSDNVQQPKANMTTPDGVVVKFIESLGKRDFSAAFGLMTEKRRGSYSQFSSTKGYGGITSTKIFSCSFTGENDGKSEVLVDYESIDPSNKSGRFKQYFYLTRFNNSYLINEIKNINLEWY